MTSPDQTPAVRPTPVDRERLRASVDRLMSIYSEISGTATDVMARRCPYKDARSRCHANFGCRNQFFTRVPAQLPACTGSDQIDYRGAWED